MCFIMQNQCTILGSFYQPIQNTHLVKVEPAKDFRFVYHCLLSNPVNLHDCECQLGLVSKFMSSFSHSLGLLGWTRFVLLQGQNGAFITILLLTCCLNGRSLQWILEFHCKVDDLLGVKWNTASSSAGSWRRNSCKRISAPPKPWALSLSGRSRKPGGVPGTWRCIKKTNTLKPGAYLKVYNGVCGLDWGSTERIGLEFIRRMGKVESYWDYSKCCRKYFLFLLNIVTGLNPPWPHLTSDISPSRCFYSFFPCSFTYLTPRCYLIPGH